MTKVIIYTKDYCPYCVKAINLLKKKDVLVEEIDITHDMGLQQEMFDKAEGRRTVPQIFIDDRPIGGCDDLYALEASGKLDPLLGK